MASPLEDDTISRVAANRCDPVRWLANQTPDDRGRARRTRQNRLFGCRRVGAGLDPATTRTPCRAAARKASPRRCSDRIGKSKPWQRPAPAPALAQSVATGRSHRRSCRAKCAFRDRMPEICQIAAPPGPACLRSGRKRLAPNSHSTRFRCRGPSVFLRYFPPRLSPSMALLLCATRRLQALHPVQAGAAADLDSPLRLHELSSGLIFQQRRVPGYAHHDLPSPGRDFWCSRGGDTDQRTLHHRQ